MEKEFNAYETFLSKEEELELIQKVCPEVKTLEETFRIEFVVANDKIDDADEKFDVHTLENIVMLMEHKKIDVENHPQLQFTEYHSFIRTNLEGINEVISKAFVKFEDIKDIDSFSALKEIDNKNYKLYTSLSVRNVTCSICGEVWGFCEHKAGQYYDGKYCHKILNGAIDLYDIVLGEKKEKEEKDTMKINEKTEREPYIEKISQMMFEKPIDYNKFLDVLNLKKGAEYTFQHGKFDFSFKVDANIFCKLSFEAIMDMILYPNFIKKYELINEIEQCFLHDLHLIIPSITYFQRFDDELVLYNEDENAVIRVNIDNLFAKRHFIDLPENHLYALSEFLDDEENEDEY